MNSGIQTRRSNILRVGKDVLVLVEMTILSNKTTGNSTSWFTDTEMLELLILVKDVVCKRVEEYPCQQPEMKRKKKETLPKAGMKVQPPVMLTGQRVKLGVQFVRHYISRTCLLPKECPGPQDDDEGESSSHSGGGYDMLHLFPEKLQVIVCEYMPLSGITNENQQTSSYFDATKTSGERNNTQTNTAKKKKLQLKRIVSSSSGSSVCKKSTLHGGFETSIAPSKCTSKLSSPSCQQSQENKKHNSLEEAPSLSKYEIAATSDVNVMSETECKITSHEERDVYSFESDSERGDTELKISPRKKCAKESEMSNSVQNCLTVSVPCQSTSPKCLLDSPLNNKSSKEQFTLKSDYERGVTGVTSGPKQSKLSLKRDKKIRDDLTLNSNNVSKGVEELDTGVKPLDIRTQTDSNTENQTDAVGPSTLSLSGKKRKLGSTNIDDTPDKQVINSKEGQTYTAIPEHCSSQVQLRENSCYSPDGKTKRRKLTKKLSQSHCKWDLSSSDDDESFNIDLLRFRKKKRKKGKKPLTNSEGDISGESGKDTDTVGAKAHDQSDNAFSSDEDVLPDANFVKGATPLTREATEEEYESSKDGKVSPTFDRSIETSKVSGFSKTKQQSKLFQYQTSLKTKRTEAGNGSGINPKLMGRKRNDKSEKENCGDSDSDTTVPVYLSEDSREAQEKDVSREEELVIADRLDQNQSEVGKSLYSADQCQSPTSIGRNDAKKHVIEKTALSAEKQCDDNYLKDVTSLNSLHSDDSLLEVDVVEQSAEGSSEKRKIFSFHDESKYSVKDMPVMQGEERNKEETSGVCSKSPQDDLLRPHSDLLSTQDDLLSTHGDLLIPQDDLPDSQDDFLGPQDDLLDSQDDLLDPQDDLLSPQDDLLSPQDDLLSDDNQQENLCSSHRLKKPTSKKQNFFQVDNYENVANQSDDISFERKFTKAARKKKAPLRTKNSQNGGPFGSLKRFDDTRAPKKSRNPSLQNRRCSQIQVTPQNLDKWWLPKNGKKKERKSEVVDLVAMEEKMEEALKLVKSVSELTEEQLRYLTQNNEDYLIEIFQGKKPCHRHQEYKSSSALRTRMTYLVSYGDFPEDSLETIMDSLVPMFCRKGSKYLDYVSKVLLPELLVKICMDVLHVDYQEAEKMF